MTLAKKITMKPVTCNEAVHACKVFDDFMAECKQQLAKSVKPKTKAMKTMKAMKASKKAAACATAKAEAKSNKTKKTVTKKTKTTMKKKNLKEKGKRHVVRGYRWINSSSS
jgi:hypothetical protein